MQFLRCKPCFVISKEKRQLEKSPCYSSTNAGCKMLKTKDCAEAIRLVNLLNGRAVVVSGSSAARSATGHTARHATLGTARLLVESGPVKTLAYVSKD
jgi:hypothetical protein